MKEAMKLALEALKSISEMVDYEGNGFKLEDEIKALEEALAKQEQDWSLLEATQNSLREHMVRIKELEAQLVKQEQGEPVTKETASAHMTELLMTFVDIASMFPTQKPASYAWERVLIFAPKQEQGEPVAMQMDVIVVNLVREGINKHRARELADHFIKTATPQPKQEQGDPYTIHTLHCVCGKTWQMDVYPPKLKENT